MSRFSSVSTVAAVLFLGCATVKNAEKSVVAKCEGQVADDVVQIAFSALQDPTDWRAEIGKAGKAKGLDVVTCAVQAVLMSFKPADAMAPRRAALVLGPQDSVVFERAVTFLVER